MGKVSSAKSAKKLKLSRSEKRKLKQLNTPKVPEPSTEDVPIVPSEEEKVVENLSAEPLTEKYAIFKDEELVKKFLNVTMTNNQKGRMRQVLKNSLRGTSKQLLPDVIHNRIQAIVEHTDALTDAELRKIRILYNMLKSTIYIDKTIKTIKKDRTKRKKNVKKDSHVTETNVNEEKDKIEDSLKTEETIATIKKDRKKGNKNAKKDNQLIETMNDNEEEDKIEQSTLKAEEIKKDKKRRNKNVTKDLVTETNDNDEKEKIEDDTLKAEGTITEIKKHKKRKNKTANNKDIAETYNTDNIENEKATDIEMTVNKQGMDNKKDVKKGKDKTSQKVKGPKRYVVFVGNLPLGIDKEKIIQHFSDFRDYVVSVRIPKQDEGKKSGIAYVEMKNEPSYELALSKHHTMIDNKRINVLYTTQKNSKVSKAEAKGKSAKLIALQKSGQLMGSIPMNQKRSQRRLKAKQAKAKLEAESELRRK